jgi:transcriptional regulator with XRE-family HTH domain
MAAVAPNERLRAIRRAMRLSQAEFARAVKAAGDRAGEPNSCTQQQVQRWERGDTREPQAYYLRALEAVTGQPAENLGFRADERYDLDAGALGLPGEDSFPGPDVRSAATPFSGIWLSKYVYESSGRGQTYSNAHYVMVLQHGAKLQVRSLPGTASGRLIMDLTVNGAVVTGTWTEQTEPNGYYGGAVYHGAIQMLTEPTGQRISGKWVGFGRDFDLNTGPWTLERVTSDTGPAAIAEYNRPVEGEHNRPVEPGTEL